MKYTLAENFSETSGTVSNLHGFLHCFNDRSFRKKWTGYWVPPYKFLDYYAVKINGVWLDSGTLQCTEYGKEFVFHHELDSHKIKEKVSAPESLPGLKIELEIKNKTEEPKAVRVVLEAGVDIRHKSHDIGPENYELDTGTGRISVSGNGKNMMISSDEDFDLEGESYVKEHFPGEKQRCFVPGDIVLKREVGPHSKDDLEFEFTTSEGSFGSLRDVEQEFRSEELGRTFENCIDSIENLVYDRKGKGLIAGHPWFQSYWARDSFWTLLGMIDAGHFSLAEEILENFTDHGLNPRIFLEGDGDSFPRADTYPLFIITCDKLRRHYGLNEKLEEAVEEASARLEFEGELVEHEPEATWMDTLERSRAVDIQSLWLEAARITGGDRQEELEEGLEKFQESDYMKDHLDEDSPSTINPAVPLLFGQIDKDRAERYLEKINACFSSRYGARTRSMTDPGYESSGYHNGSVWGLTTAWTAAANLRYRNEKQGLNLLEKMTQFLDRNQLGALPEVVDAENGELIGAPEQAWSAGMFIHVVDSYLLGIKVKEDYVEIDPADINCERKGKKIRGERLDLKIEDGEVEILNDPDIDIRL